MPGKDDVEPTQDIADAADPPAVTVVNEAGASPIVLLCEHASNHIPARYRNLGLPATELSRHIAYDIGAADVARHLSRKLDAILLLSGYSRLLIDCNRPLAASTSIPERSEATDIPGNIGIDAAERSRRDALFFAPFRDRVAATLDARLHAGRKTILIGMHSFTPVYLGVARPWQAGFLYDRAKQLGATLISGLRAADPRLVVGDNQPYQITLEGDYTVPYQGDARGIPTALIEVRQDLVATAQGAAEWAERLAGVLATVAA
jgi:predicted N-formylglutamate amidohydrolase